MKTITAWAICDNDGKRTEARPLARLIYSTQLEAKQAAKYLGLEIQYYPIHKVDIKLSKN